MLNPKALGLDARPYSLGLGGAAKPKGLGSASCHTQETWLGFLFPTPSFLGLEGDVIPKLIIIIIYFAFQIKSMFFSIVIIFI